jgi:hypothetical protein
MTGSGHSTVAKWARAGLTRLEEALPPAPGRVLRETAFSAYKTLVRLAYLRRPLLSTLRGKQQDAERQWLVFRLMPYSLVGWKGLELTYACVRQAQARGLTGDLVECGVARGGSAALMALANERVQDPGMLWLFDSYEGLPDPTSEDFEDDSTGAHVRPLHRGSCLGTYDEVASLLFGTLKLRRDRVTMVQGWFQDTLPEKAPGIPAISVLRLDGDWYASTLCCLEHLYDKVVPGGFVILDDYHSCFGCARAADEFLARRGVRVRIEPDGRGGAYFVKPA